MKLRTLHPRDPCTQDDRNSAFKFVWDEDKREAFRENILSDPVQDILDKSVDSAFTDIDTSIDHIVEALCLAASDMKKECGNTRRTLNSWYDRECKKLKSERCKALNRFRKRKNKFSLEQYILARNRYNSFCKQKRLAYYKDKQNRIENNYQRL